jgi:hypothetical protein
MALRCWSKIWYAAVILLVLEVTFLIGTGGIAAGYGKIVFYQYKKMAMQANWIKENIPYVCWINVYSRAAGVDARLVAAVIRAESSFQPGVVSRAGAVGLMQVMPDTWKQVNDQYKICAGGKQGESQEDLYFDPELNIHIGTVYLGQLIKRYDGNVLLALAAYNAGPAAVDRCGGLPPYEETLTYLERIADYWRGGPGGAIRSLCRWERVHNSIWRWTEITGVIAVLVTLRLLLFCRIRQWRR